MQELTLFDLELPSKAQEKIGLFKNRELSGGAASR